MKKIICFYEILSREYKACERLKNILLKKYNIEVKLFSIAFEFNKAIKFAKKNGVDAVIMPWMYSKREYNFVMPFLEINENLTVFNLYHEQIASDETLPILILKDEIVKQNVYHLCWGTYFQDVLIKNGTPAKNTLISGNIRLDGMLASKIEKELLSQQFNLDINKQWILFAESRDWVLDEINLKNRENLGLDEELEKQSFFWHKKSLESTYKEMSCLDDSFFEKYELIYRPHPATPAPKNLNSRIKVISQYTIYDWLANVDYYLTSTSTSIFEAEAMGVLPMVVNISDFPQTFKTYGLDNYYSINSLLEFTEQNIVNARKWMENKKIYTKYIGESDGGNTERTADVINSILNSENRIQMLKLPFKSQDIWHKIYKIYAKIMLKLNMSFMLLKKSESYILRNEYPRLHKNKKIYNIK